MLIIFFQLPYKTGPQTTHSRINEEQNKNSLIQISRYKFSLVISGLTKILHNVNEQFPPSSISGAPRHNPDTERNFYESLLIVLDTLERCLSNQQKDTAKFEEAVNVKLLLREICQFIDVSNENPNGHALKLLACKVLFALSLNFFNAVFNRISAKLQELSTSTDENADLGDIELLQHINVDIHRLIRLLQGNFPSFSTEKDVFEVSIQVPASLNLSRVLMASNNFIFFFY